MKKINLLLLTGLVLLPAIPLSAQTFEDVFKKGAYSVPTFFDDVNNDGKLEYLWNYNRDIQLIPTLYFLKTAKYQIVLREKWSWRII